MDIPILRAYACYQCAKVVWLDLEPGIYEVFIDKSFYRDQFNQLIEYRPQRILNVVIESNKRTLLNITVHEGNELEEIGRPQ